MPVSLIQEVYFVGKFYALSEMIFMSMTILAMLSFNFMEAFGT